VQLGADGRLPLKVGLFNEAVHLFFSCLWRDTTRKKRRLLAGPSFLVSGCGCSGLDVSRTAAALFAHTAFECEIDPIAESDDLAAQGDEAERLAVELVDRPPSLGIAPNVRGDLARSVEGLPSRLSGKTIGHRKSSAEL
jgi:hypothetical protein